MLRQVLLVTGIALLLSGCGTTDPTNEQSNEPTVFTGEVQSVVDSSNVLSLSKFKEGAPCTSGQNVSAATGSQVLLLDASGTILGTGSLGAGTLLRPDSSLPNYLCQMKFTISAEEVSGNLFTIRIGSLEHTYSLDEIESGPILQIGTLFWH